jgi:hypothetical protein
VIFLSDVWPKVGNWPSSSFYFRQIAIENPLNGSLTFKSGWIFRDDAVDHLFFSEQFAFDQSTLFNEDRWLRRGGGSPGYKNK